MKYIIQNITVLILLFTVNPVFAQKLARPNFQAPLELEVNSYNGNLFYKKEGFHIPVRGGGINVNFYYNSRLRQRNASFGNGWTHEYNISYYIDSLDIIIEYGNGKRTKFLQKSGGYYSIRNPLEKIIEYEPGKLLLTEQTGRRLYFNSNQHKKISKIEDTNNNYIEMVYVGANLTKIISEQGREVVFHWIDSKLNNITYGSSPNEKMIELKYKGNNLIEIKSVNGHIEQYYYDGFNRLIRLGDVEGTSMKIEYDEISRVKKIVSCLGEQDFVFQDDKTFLIEKNNGALYLSSMYFNPEGQITKVTNATGNSSEFKYDSLGSLVEYKNFKGSKYFYTYDIYGNITSETDPAGNKYLISYYPNHIVKTITDKNGNTISYEYDNNLNIVKITTPENGVYILEYNPNGDIIEISDPLGEKTNFKYDAFGNLSEFFINGIPVRVERDSFSNITKIIDRDGNNINIQYNLLDDINKIESPSIFTVESQYDDKGNLIFRKDGYYERMFEYDPLNRLRHVKTPLSEVNYEFDFKGNLIRWTDPLKHTYSCTYNGLNLPLEINDPLQQKSTLEYDQNGNLTRHKDKNGQEVILEYDSNDRLIKRSYPGNTDYYVYDAEGNLINAYNDNVNIRFEYDEMNRIRSKNYLTWNKKIDYTYDKRNNRKTMTDPNGGITKYEYDAVGRLIKVENHKGELFEMSYDPKGQLIQQKFPNQCKSQYQYDNGGRLTGLRHSSQNDATINSYFYEFNDNFQRKSLQYENGQKDIYSYDADLRLTSVKYGTGRADSFTLDAFGNRINLLSDTFSIINSYNEINQLAYTNDTKCESDPNGNLISTTINDTTVLYTYDGLNRLIEVKLPGGESTKYTYDPFGNRLSKILNSGEIRYILDGVNTLMELGQQNNTIRRYTSGLYYDQWLSLDQNNESSFYILDGKGNVSGLLNASGDLINQYRYDVFGNLLFSIVNTPNSRLFAGKEYDQESGLYYFRARYYDPKSGRFITQDRFPGVINLPLSLNRYIYVGADPVNYADPDGAFWTGIVIGAGIGAGIEIGTQVTTQLAQGSSFEESINKINWIDVGVEAGFGALDGIPFGSQVKGAYKILKYRSYQRRLDNLRDFNNLSKKLDVYDKLDNKIKKEIIDQGKEIFIEDPIEDIIKEETKKQLNKIPNPDLDGDVMPDTPDENDNDQEEEPDPGPDDPSGNCEIDSITGAMKCTMACICNYNCMCIDRVHAVDPNDIVGPLGYSVPRYIGGKTSLQYLIRFENDPDFATAPAQRVTVRMPVDSNHRLYSFRVGEFGFGHFRYQPPADMSYFKTRITNTVDSLRVYVDFTAGIDVTKNEAFWVFESIDPVTGLRPDDALTGFLPVNDTSITRFNDTIPKPGEGFVTFFIQPRDGAVTGDTCKAQAGIVFDINPAIATNIWTNVVDAFPPQSKVKTLPPFIPSNALKLEWDADDDPGGAGVRDFDLYVSKNNSPFYLHQADIDTNYYFFQGEPGVKYDFYTRAIDHVGNEEPPKDKGESSVTLGVQSFISIASPLEGQQYCVFDSAVIQWQAYNAGNDFDVFLSTDGGSHFEKIFQQQDTFDNNLIWVVPASYGINGSNDCIFLIRSAADTTLFGLSKPFVLLQSPLFELGPDTTLIQGNVLTLMAGTFTGATYIWNSGATTNTITVDQTGLYAATVTDSNGCQASDSIQVNVVVATNAPAFAHALKLYPNPASTRLFLQVDHQAETTLQMALLEPNGRVIKYLPPVSTLNGRFLTSIDIQELPGGAYLLKMETPDGKVATLVFEKFP